MSDIPHYQVAVSAPAHQILAYSGGEQEVSEERIGCRVHVPVGNRTEVGIIVGVKDKDPGFSLRSVSEYLEEHQVVSSEILQLTRWVADYYICGWSEALRTTLPAGLMKAPEWIVEWCGSDFEGLWPPEILTNKPLLKISRMIAGAGRTTHKALSKKYPTTTLRKDLSYLKSLGVVTIRERLALDTKHAVTVDVISLAKPDAVNDLPASFKAKKRLLVCLQEAGGMLAWPELRTRADVSRSVLNSLLKDEIVSVKPMPKHSAAIGFDPSAGKNEFELTPDQQKAVEIVNSAVETAEYSAFLLRGLPGSGKTIVYLEILKHALDQGKGVILLVPEIALTPQVVARIQSSIDEPVAVLHSGLTATQRFSTWREVHKGRIRVVVGPRSAIFAPVANLGLVIVDEEHEESYKQQNPAPRYQGRDVAMVRAQLSNAPVLLVSATPSLETLQLVQRKKIRELAITDRSRSWPRIRVVDRTREHGGASYISPDLAAEIKFRQEREEGIVLLVTRRGFAPVVACGDCGHVVQCRNCAVSLTYHKVAQDLGRLICHHCGFSSEVPDECPECESKKLSVQGAGSQRIEEELAEQFPELHTARMDRDSTQKQGGHEELLREFASGDSQILLGTQMVAKGHDFSNVTLVGIVNADPSLFLPDFRAGERTFRLIVQAIGRAGRSGQDAVAVVQTIAPEHPLFKALQAEGGPDYNHFAEGILRERSILQYPPFAKMAMLTIDSEQEELAEKVADEVDSILRKGGPPLVVAGPAPAMILRLKRRFRWKLSLRTNRKDDPKGKLLRSRIREVMQKVKLPSKVNIIIDVDPVEVL